MFKRPVGMGSWFWCEGQPKKMLSKPGSSQPHISFTSSAFTAEVNENLQ